MSCVISHCSIIIQKSICSSANNTRTQHSQIQYPITLKIDCACTIYRAPASQSSRRPIQAQSILRSIRMLDVRLVYCGVKVKLSYSGVKHLKGRCIKIINKHKSVIFYNIKSVFQTTKVTNTNLYELKYDCVCGLTCLSRT